MDRADRDRDRLHPRQIQVHSDQQPHRYDAGGAKSLLPRNGPSTSQVLAILTLLPIGGSLLGLAGITLVGSLLGLAVATPLFVIFSPILLPAAILIAGTVAAFLTSGAFGLRGSRRCRGCSTRSARPRGRSPSTTRRGACRRGRCTSGRRRSRSARRSRARPRRAGPMKAEAPKLAAALPRLEEGGAIWIE